MSAHGQKTQKLLEFLQALAGLRRKRNSAYGEPDRILWFADLPRNLPPTSRDACKSAFIAEKPEEIPDLWLEVRKNRKPEFRPLPAKLRDWVPQKFQTQPEQYLEKSLEHLLDLLNSEITVLVEKRVPGPKAPPSEDPTSPEAIPEVRRLNDYPGVQNAWLDYLLNQWEPWAQEMRSCKQIQEIYEHVDFMRRRLEEAEERYELVLAVGLLQWRDSTGVVVKRHLLTAPAEISLDPARGILTVGPAATFERFRVEMDMLELQDRPRLEDTGIDEKLEELDIRAWDKASVAGILRIIANKASADSEVSEDVKPLEHADRTFRIVYAPALVLRERRPTAYDELIRKFLERCSDGPSFSTTPPWERFVSEGEPQTHSTLEFEPAFRLKNVDDRLYFPLPTNDEQRRIVERLRDRPYVLVKGPPGTGKSHTIANLICHLLAAGERVLVTAHAPKALTVLRDLLPADIRTLCVTALGSSREDQRLLEDSVRGILARKNEWRGKEWARGEISRLEKELHELEAEAAEVEQQLRECREAETYSHTLAGGYEGTAARIAKRLAEEQNAYGWFPELLDDQRYCPLEREDIEFFAEFHAALTKERLHELHLETGTFALPDPDAFARAIEELTAAERAAEAVRDGLPEEYANALGPCSEADLHECRGFLTQLEEHATRAESVLGDLTGEILKDLLIDRTGRWERLERQVSDLVEQMPGARDRLGTARIEVPSDIERAKLVADTRRRLEHFRKGGRRGWGAFAPRVVRETGYIEKGCRVNGEPPHDQKALDTLLGFLELETLLEQFASIWPRPMAVHHSNPAHAVDEVSDLSQGLSRLLELLRAPNRRALGVIPIEKRASLVELQERRRWRRSIEAELALRRARRARAQLDERLRAICSLGREGAHPCMAELIEAIETRDVERWSAAWRVRERLRAEKDRFRRYQEMVRRLKEACPDLISLLQSTQGNPEWKKRLRELDKAWTWAAAKTWLHRVTDPARYGQLIEERQRLQQRIEKKLKEVAAIKAWAAFFQRLDDHTEQNLIAWTKAVARIGKGTGKHAYRHRRSAREYLMACIPKIPCWIMPLHKLWETTGPTPGVFDTVIVDEASQAGIESLVLLLLAKRIIVVGDDKQNSPEAVGVLEDDVARLARDYLSEFRFKEEFRPDTSLYDHAERAFGNPISLREHFRCVPEIIRFSNDLCYKDAPLIPLRQPPPDRLPPLKAEFVTGAQCEGEGQRIINREEAEAIVTRILECINDPAYKKKSMGVIVLQGHGQAQLIERKLAEVLDPRVREERKLRCGVPATFQGDERDVVFLSLVVAPNHRFRALTELEAQRRFNVAMSRAREQVWLFHSVQLDDLSREDLRWRLLNFFYSPAQLEVVYEELERLEREALRSSRQLGNQPAPYGSWFEVDVALELLRRHYRVRPQYDVAGYRIDLVVEGLSNRLAVECDGEAWHGPDRFEQDMARQRQLERAGWKFVRIRESEFYADRESAIRRIVERCKELGIRPLGKEGAVLDEVGNHGTQQGQVGDGAGSTGDMPETAREGDV
jgi:very-short-patch-repair endonuclease